MSWLHPITSQFAQFLGTVQFRNPRVDILDFYGFRALVDGVFP
jgi:hypothetical protein